MANDRGIPLAPWRPVSASLALRQPDYTDRMHSLYSGGITPVREKPGAAEALIALLGSAGTGVLLGGLQANLKDGLDYGGKVPLDGLLSLLATAGGLAYDSPASVRIGQNAAAIYTFRKTAGLLTLLRSMVAGERGSVSVPDLSADPLGDAAKGL